MSKIEHLTTPAQLSALLSKNTVVVLDFHATWCGPCKVIAPVFESLAATHSSANKVAFAKIDVDQAQALASAYSVRAMPTFLILKARSEVARIQGADRAALTAAVERHCRDVKSAYTGKGYTLGGAEPAKKTYVKKGEVVQGVPLGARVWGWWEVLRKGVVLWAVSLFSLDPLEAVRGWVAGGEGAAATGAARPVGRSRGRTLAGN